MHQSLQSSGVNFLTHTPKIIWPKFMAKSAHDIYITFTCLIPQIPMYQTSINNPFTLILPMENVLRSPQLGNPDSELPSVSPCQEGTEKYRNRDQLTHHLVNSKGFFGRYTYSYDSLIRIEHSKHHFNSYRGFVEEKKLR